MMLDTPSPNLHLGKYVLDKCWTTGRAGAPEMAGTRSGPGGAGVGNYKVRAVGATVVAADVAASNDVIHVIDTVMLPKEVDRR